jgi:flagellar motor switch/type III secretory pathway protein FliN
MEFRHMATSQPQPSAGGQPLRAVAPPADAEAARQARGLVPAPTPPQEEEEDGEMRLGSPVARLPVELDVVIPVRDFRVRNLLALAPGDLIESQWSNGEDVPLAAGHVQLAWSEFEVVESQLSVRITRLA